MRPSLQLRPAIPSDYWSSPAHHHCTPLPSRSEGVSEYRPSHQAQGFRGKPHPCRAQFRLFGLIDQRTNGTPLGSQEPEHRNLIPAQHVSTRRIPTGHPLVWRHPKSSHKVPDSHHSGHEGNQTFFEVRRFKKLALSDDRGNQEVRTGSLSRR